jgi:hypothetical protein
MGADGLDVAADGVGPFPKSTVSASFTTAWSATIIDHEDNQIAGVDSLARLERACRRAAQQRLEEPPPSTSSLFARADPEAATALTPSESSSKDISIAYLIMGHRRFAHTTISRLLHALWHPSHSFLLHLDARTNATAVDDLKARYAARQNVHVMSSRRSIGWGAFSMVELLLTALATSLHAHPSFDFFINLSDADVALRTNREIVTFLQPFRGRSFVSVKFPLADGMRYAAHAHMRKSSWLECEGEGFLILNQTGGEFFGGEQRRCCYARSGPIVYANLPITRPEPPDRFDFFHGSQWVVLARPAVEWLVNDADAAAFARHVSLTYMADESYVQSALMASTAMRSTLINHNLRYIDWPHGYGDPVKYYQSVDSRHWSGPMVLTGERFDKVISSPALFARKADIDDQGGVSFMRKWDQWISAKLVLERADAADTEIAAARQVLSAVPEQPAIAEPLLRDDPTLEKVLPPPTRDELTRLSQEEVERRSTPKPVHFGAEDLMAAQQTAAAPVVPPPQEVAEVDPFARQSSEHDAKWESAEENATLAFPRLAEMVFHDGSRCSCDGEGLRCDVWECPSTSGSI